MKTAHAIQTELSNLLELLIHGEVAIVANRVVRQNLGSGLSRITWAQNHAISSPTFQCDFGSIEEYMSWVQAGAYSAILYDGAMVQLSYDFAGNDLIANRLVYYPCPFNVDEILLREEPVLDVLEMYEQQGNSYVRLRTPLRFDFNLEDQTEGHPASHLTMLSNKCRWAVVAPLSPGHFVRFIFRHFYPALWSVHDFLREWPQRLGDRTITPEEENLLHIACARQ